jgi:hypothetical protein
VRTSGDAVTLRRSLLPWVLRVPAESTVSDPEHGGRRRRADHARLGSISVPVLLHGEEAAPGPS